MENNKQLVVEIVDAIKVELEPQFGAIGKNFDVIGKKFDAIDKRFERVDEQFKSLKVELTEKMDEGFHRQGVLLEAMQGDIDTLVDGQEILHERIDRIEGTVVRIEATVEDIDMRLTAVEIG